MYLKKRQEIGFLLIIDGIYISNIMHEVFSFFPKELSSIIMFIGVLLIADWNNVFQIKFPRLTSKVFFLAVFQLYLMFYLILYSNAYISDSFGKDTLYCLFAIALTFSAASIDRSQRLCILPKMLFYVNFLLLVLLTYIVLNDSSYSVGVRYVLSSGGDAITLALGCTTFAITILIYEVKNIIERVMKILSSVLVIACTIFFQTRVALFGVILVLIIYCALNNKISINISKKKIIRCGILILSTILLSKILMQYQFFQDGWTLMYNRTLKGILTFLGINNDFGVDASAVNRTMTMAQSWEIIYSRGILQTLFGNGYMTLYVDVPILQAFLDLGLIGGIMYSFFIVILPINLLFSRKKKQVFRADEDLWMQYMLFIFLTVQVIAKQIISALPYGADVYWPAILCLTMVQYLPSKNID